MPCNGNIIGFVNEILRILLWKYCGPCYGKIVDFVMRILRVLLWEYLWPCYRNIEAGPRSQVDKRADS